MKKDYDNKMLTTTTDSVELTEVVEVRPAKKLKIYNFPADGFSTKAESMEVARQILAEHKNNSK